MKIEVCYAGGKQQLLVALEIKEGSCVKDAITQSGVLQQFPELGSNLQMIENNLGIFGELQSLDTRLKEGDRVEIYRSLLIDPKEARRQRAVKERALQKKLRLASKKRIIPNQKPDHF